MEELKCTYLIGKYILGMKNIPLFSDLAIKLGERELLFNFALEDKIKEFKIPYKNIKEISFKEQNIVSTIPKKVVANDEVNMALALFLVGPGLGSMALSSVLNELDEDYNKVDLKEHFEITLKYLYNDVECKLLFSTIKNPNIFIDEINNKKV